LLSGYLKPADQQKAESLNFAAILEKSTTADELAATLAKILSSVPAIRV
jgi:hypothetical protein